MKQEYKNVIIEICESMIKCIKDDDLDGISRLFQTLQGALSAVLSIRSFEQYLEKNQKDNE